MTPIFLSTRFARSRRAGSSCAFAASILFTAAAALSAAEAPVYEFSHFAGGTGGPAYVDGQGADARFGQPGGVAVNAQGVIYVADGGNGAIRLISATGAVSTLAIRAEEEPEDSDERALLAPPSALALDLEGNVITTGFSVVQKVSPAGEVSTLAGQLDVFGGLNGTGAAARFYGASGVVVDTAGRVFVADQYNHAIRRITSDGQVTTSAGQLGVAASMDPSDPRLLYPRGLGIDDTNVIFVLDVFGRSLRRIPAGGSYPVTMVDYTTGTLAGGKGIAVGPDGSVYVADTQNHTIKRVSSSGMVTTVAGRAGVAGCQDGGGAEALFREPSWVAVDPDGNIIVSDTGNLAIRKVTPDGVVTTLAGADGPQPGFVDGQVEARFQRPVAVVAAPNGELFVADYFNSAIRRVSTDGSVSTFVSGLTGRPEDLTLDVQGNLYVTTTVNTVLRISPHGVIDVFAGAESPSSSGVDGIGGSARFARPTGIASDTAGNLYVRDSYDATIRKITPSRVVTTLAGSAGQFDQVDGNGASARFRGGKAIAVDSAANIYVADESAIRKITPGGDVTTIAGNVELTGHVDGLASSARFTSISALAFDAAGELYIIDRSLIRKLSAAGIVSTIGGNRYRLGKANGSGLTAKFHYPLDVAVDAAGALYVADTSNHAIRKAVVVRSAPTIVSEPSDVRVTVGRPATIVADASGDGTLNFQWQRSPAGSSTWAIIGDDAMYTGATTLVLSVLETNTAMNGDRFRCIITNAAGTITTRELTLTVSDTRLVNISTRAYGSTGNSVTIGGFVIAGSAPKRLLLRAVGLTLITQGIGAGSVMLDPTIDVFDAHRGNAVIASIDNWADNTNPTEITTVGAQLGAAAFAANDANSAAVILTLDPGVYTFIARGKAETSGIVLVEAYDADAATAGSTFSNISTRAYCMTGDRVSIGGFVVSGNAPKRVLLRAVGPTLATQGLGVAEVLADPMISVHDARNGNAVIATNDNWNDNAMPDEIVTNGARLGATPFAASDTTSSALLLTLQPGIYTFIASGKAGTSGIVLVEVYDAD